MLLWFSSESWNAFRRVQLFRIPWSTSAFPKEAPHGSHKRSMYLLPGSMGREVPGGAAQTSCRLSTI